MKFRNVTERRHFLKYGTVATLRHLYELYSDEVSAETRNFEFTSSEKTVTTTSLCHFKQDRHF